MFDLTQNILTYLIPVVLIILLIMILAVGYVKAPPDRAFIISGLKKEPKILIGRAGIRVPFLERLDKLYLGQMTVDIKTEQSVPTTDFINVNVDAVAKVRIDPTTEGIRLAAKNFLNKNSEQITRDLQDSLQGNMREIIGTLTLKSINTDRDSFSDQVMEKASKDMKKLGIEVVSCNIQNVTDENGLIKDLGADNTAKIKKDASIARAQAERDVAIAQAEANKASNDARVLAETEIAEKNNELAIKKAELQQVSDTKQAMADAAYKIQEQEQEKVIQTATVNAQIAKAEREAELRKQEVLVKQQALEAEINKKADADRYAVEQAAAAALAKRQRDDRYLWSRTLRPGSMRPSRMPRRRRPRRRQRSMRPSRMPWQRRLRQRRISTLWNRRQPVSRPEVRRKRKPSVRRVWQRQKPWRRRPRLIRSTTKRLWRKCSSAYFRILPERLPSRWPRLTRSPLSEAERTRA